MKRIVILTLIVFMISACGQVVNDTTNLSTPAIPTEIVEATLEPTVISDPTATSDETIQDNTLPTFTKGSQTLGTTRSYDISVADFDMDNDIDILIADYFGRQQLWINNGNRDFSSSGHLFGRQYEGVHDLETADLNGDGYLDAFTVAHDSDNRIFFNDGTGVFTESEQSITEINTPLWLLLGDVDGDEDIDAIIIYESIPNPLWLNDGSGFFTLSDRSYGGNTLGGMDMADFNGDSAPDLFFNNYSLPGELWFNDGAGNFTDSGQTFGDETGGYGSAFGDIDGDGDLDIIKAGRNSGSFSVWLNQDTSGFFEKADTYLEPDIYKTHLYDADEDGDLDLITVSNESVNKLWLNDGFGSYTSLGEVFDNIRVLSIGTGDFDGDGDNDVVFSYWEDNINNSIFWND